jgi:ferredoxin-NADP reductase
VSIESTPAPAGAPLARWARRSTAAVAGLVSDVAGLAATPLVPADYLDTLAPLRRGAHRARIVAVRAETSDAATVVLRPATPWPGHRAGQNVRLGVDVDGVRHWRSYSLTSRADAEGTISVTVSAVAGGIVSTHLVRDARSGDVVGLEGPEGDFVLPAELPAQSLFVTAGSGITPVIGMLRTSLHELDDVVVVHSARSPQDVLFARELRWWARRGLLRLVERHTSVDGRLAPEDLEALVPDIARRSTWVCGPNGLVDGVAGLFADRGWSQRLHVERFRPVLAPVGDGGTATFVRAGLDVEVDGATSLLDAGEAAGVLMPSGCRMGICFGCVVPLAEGTVRDLRSGDLTTAAPGETVLVQTCISSAAGACRVDA